MVRIHRAERNFPGLEQSEIDAFLTDSKIPLRLGTIDSKDHPMIHPVWFQYSNNKLYLFSNKDARKVRNIRGKKTVYFSVDTDALPNKGVRGKGTATILNDVGKSVSITEKIVAKYLGDLNTPMAKSMVDGVRKGAAILVEITPFYFSTWDYSKMKY
jgi:nitroimidazol reductase NimA-like FMN-containing flavoprotein (pyridoxamine 5'-phosphate oxidase superfamily)